MTISAYDDCMQNPLLCRPICSNAALDCSQGEVCCPFAQDVVGIQGICHLANMYSSIYALTQEGKVEKKRFLKSFHQSQEFDTIYKIIATDILLLIIAYCFIRLELHPTVRQSLKRSKKKHKV